MTECANCGNERIMLCPFCEHDFSELSKNNEAELRQLRREVALLREVEGAVRAHVEDWDSQVSDPGAACYQCEDPSDIKALRTAIKALEAAR